jgi:hypothetical protein
MLSFNKQRFYEESALQKVRMLSQVVCCITDAWAELRFGLNVLRKTYNEKMLLSLTRDVSLVDHAA